MTGGPERLRKALDDAIREAVSGKDPAVAFSGGLDSGIIAAIVKEHAAHPALYTVGSEGSHDIAAAKNSAAELGMECSLIHITEENVRSGLKEMISVTGTKDPVVLSFELPLFFVCKHSKEKDIITGQGADELFAGYSKYAGLGEIDLKRARDEDLNKLREITLPHEQKVAEHFGKRMHYPFLDERVVREADSQGIITIPSDDPAARKRVLREVSDLIGYPGIARMEKKAAQYGSGSMDVIKGICKKEGVTYRELIEMLSREAE